MNEVQQLKDRAAELALEMYARHFSAPSDGNISFRIQNRHYITRSGTHKGRMTADDLIEIDALGIPTSGGKPSTETALHLKIYEQRGDVHGVVHAHPPFATAFAVAHKALDENSMSEVISTIGAIPLAPYGTPATHELPDSIEPFIKQTNAILMANHGVIAYGDDLEQAWQTLERVEHFARISFYAHLLGGPRELNPEQLDQLLHQREHVYNIQTPQIIKRSKS